MEVKNENDIVFYDFFDELFNICRDDNQTDQYDA